MISIVYIIASMLISAVAVYDYARETARKNYLYLFGVWILFLVMWPFVLGKHIIKAWRQSRIPSAGILDPRYNQYFYSIRTIENSTPEYLNKVNEVVITTPLSIRDIDENEWHLGRRLTLAELDVLGRAAVYGIHPDLRNIENINELLSKADGSGN